MDNSQSLAIAQLIKTYDEELRRVIARRCGCMETAADIVQETYQRMLSGDLWQQAENPRALLHRIAANTYPENYPKFQKQIGKVISLWEMINWCLRNPLKGTPLAGDDPKMIAMQAYVTYERRGVKLEPGKH